MLQKMAAILLAERDKTRTPKKVDVNWSFLSRQPDPNPKFARSFAYIGALCEGPVIINGFFETLLHLKQEYGIVEDDICNIDETGFAMCWEQWYYRASID